MKVKMLKYCQEKIDGHIIVLDVNKIIDLQEQDAHQLIGKGLAQEIEQNNEDKPGINNFENKMLNIIYKKRGRPRKEV